MESVVDIRIWKYEYGTGDKLVLVLPRMDHKCISKEEWDDLLEPFSEDAHFFILDMPEKMIQEKKLEFSVKGLACEVNNYLLENNILPDMIWGLSLGGMIAQELSLYDNCVDIPLLLIATNLFADIRLRAIFSSWSIIVNNYGTDGFDLSLAPWIADARDLPILDKSIYNEKNEDLVALAKIKASLRAVSLHDARNVASNIKAIVKVLFGEYSVLLGESEAETFKKYLPKADVCFIKNAGMRLLNDNKDYTIPLIKEYINLKIVN